MTDLTDLVQARLRTWAIRPRMPVVVERIAPSAPRALGALSWLNGLRVLALIADSASSESHRMPSHALGVVRPRPRHPRGSRMRLVAAPSVSPSHPQTDVKAMTARGAPLGQIENYIDSLPLPDEELSALWLLAWSETTNPALQR